MKIKLAAFDWNGTLLNDRVLAHGAMTKIFSTYGIPAPSFEVYMREIGPNYMEFYYAHGIPQTATSEDLNVIRTRHMRENWNSASLNYGAHQALRFCRDNKIKLAIVSAEQPAVLQNRLVQFQIRSFFDAVIADASGNGNGGKRKALAEVSRGSRVEPAECIYVDDSRSGLMSAKDAGFRTIGFLGGYADEETICSTNPDFLATSMLEVPDILRSV